MLEEQSPPLSTPIKTSFSCKNNNNVQLLPSIKDFPFWTPHANYFSSIPSTGFKIDSIFERNHVPTVSHPSTSHSAAHFHPYAHSIPIKKRISNLLESIAENTPIQSKQQQQQQTQEEVATKVQTSIPHENGRKRVSKACQECQARHVRCGFDRPCTRCIKIGIECKDIQTDKKRGRKTVKSKVSEETNKVATSSSNSSTPSATTLQSSLEHNASGSPPLSSLDQPSYSNSSLSSNSTLLPSIQQLFSAAQ